jgi:plastocyanin
VSKRLPILAAILAVAAAACSELPEAEVDYGSGLRFVPYVVDGTDDVGLAPSVAATVDGLPYVASFGFPEEVAEGEIAPARPIGAPFLPAVLLATASADGQWDKGAVVQAKPEVEPSGITTSFGPETVEGLEMSAESTNGTAVAVAEDGTVHVAWTAPDGVWYAETKQGGPTAVEQLFDYGSTIQVAGPVGRPGITVDPDGNPWVAYAVNAATGVEVRVATPGADGWDEQVAVDAARCNGCPQPGPTGIVVAGGAPVVGFIDPGTSQLQVATLEGDAWSVTSVAAGEGAHGLSMAVDADAPIAAFYAGGSVQVLGADGTVSEVAAAEPEGPDTGTLAPTTGIASDGAGTLFVTWQDAAGVHLASGAAGALAEIETSSTDGGASPAVAATAGGGPVYLAWHDTEDANLEVGIYGEPEDIIVARPSPSITVSVGPAPSTGCGEDGVVALDIVAKGIAWDTTCLVAPAGEPFTINIDNQDAGIPHNLNLMDAGSTTIVKTDLEAGPIQQTLDVDPLEAGEYPFICDAHPNMTGTLVAVEGAEAAK